MNKSSSYLQLISFGPVLCCDFRELPWRLAIRAGVPASSSVWQEPDRRSPPGHSNWSPDAPGRELHLEVRVQLHL